ncbi:MAG: DivIVA domain-containing protein [Clostridiaceae bacterium]
MRITSMDISNKEFKKSMRGYNSDEVEDFLDKIAEDYEEMYKENTSLREKFALLNEKLDHYKDIENTIQNTLLLAQNTSEQTRKTANDEAESIIRRANDESQRIIEKANNQVVKVNDDFQNTKSDFSKFVAKYRNFMKTQMDMFSDMESDFVKSYNLVSYKVEEVKEKGIVTEEKEEETVKEEDLNNVKNFYV